MIIINNHTKHGCHVSCHVDCHVPRIASVVDVTSRSLARHVPGVDCSTHQHWATRRTTARSRTAHLRRATASVHGPRFTSSARPCCVITHDISHVRASCAGPLSLSIKKRPVSHLTPPCACERPGHLPRVPRHQCAPGGSRCAGRHSTRGDSSAEEHTNHHRHSAWAPRLRIVAGNAPSVNHDRTAR